MFYGTGQAIVFYVTKNSTPFRTADILLMVRKDGDIEGAKRELKNALEDRLAA